MSSKPAHKPQKPESPVPGRSDREPPAAAGGESHALHGLVRLLGCQTAREFVRQQLSDSSLIERLVDDT